ncbi:MAG: metallophosphoesterase [Clostridia bacterium]|nr:metallophosphoesterase [Clostridia bacterium]
MKRELRFGKDGTFRILQISDLHSGDLYVNPPIHAIHVLLEASRPDLVVFDGDVVIDSLFEGKDYTAARVNYPPLRL